MRVSGRDIADTILKELSEKVRNLSRPPHLAIIYVGTDPVIENFIRIKKQTAQKIGVGVSVMRYAESISTDALMKEIESLVSDKTIDGIIIQQPLPNGLSVTEVLDAVSPEKDTDLLSSRARFLFEEGKGIGMPTVPGAIAEIFSHYSVSLDNKKIVIVGEGKLVGKPVATWLEQKGITPTVVTKKTISPDVLREADIIISGAGVPKLIEPDMVKEGAILIDAGTSEEGGKLSGDIDSSCEKKASLFTPVPGGVGPVTVAILFRNLVDSTHKRNTVEET